MQYKAWSPVATYGGGGAALIVMSLTTLTVFSWGFLVFLLGAGYVVKGVFEAFSNFAESYADREIGKRKVTLQELNRQRRKAARKVWYNRNYYSLQVHAKSELRDIDRKIDKLKEKMGAK